MFIFVDDTLTVSRKRTEALCREFGPEGLNVEWACYARVNDLDSEVVDLIRQYPRIFPCFYLYDVPSLPTKYDVLRKMKLSPEDVWDLWVEAKGPVPQRVKKRPDYNQDHL